MPEQQRGRTWMLAAGGVLGGLGLAAGLVWTFSGRGGGPGAGGPGAGASARAVAYSTETPLADLADGLKAGDGLALAVLVGRLTPEPDRPIATIEAGEIEAWGAVVAGLRGGFPKFSPYGRASAIAAIAQALARLAAEPAPAGWVAAVAPMHDILTASLADADPGVRVAALRTIAGFWAWAPGRDLILLEVENLAGLKEALHAEVVRSLGAPDPNVRAAAVACLAALPLDDKSRPAIAYLADEDPNVRLAVLHGFAERPTLLEAESILPLLFDRSPAVPPVAEAVLKQRGLTPDQIGLGKMVVHPRADMRVASIALIQQRTDIDSTVWLVFLSRDRDDAVRAAAVEALGTLNTPEARERLAEMAASDNSPNVRAAAAKLAPAAETTAALPPLPGSPSLNPRAN